MNGTLHCTLSTQVNRPGFGWEDVPSAAARDEEEEEEPCRLVVLVGAQLERATGGALKAVRHRVVVEDNDNNTAGDGSPLRRSLVFRLRARHTAVLDPLQLAPKYACVCACLRAFCLHVCGP